MAPSSTPSSETTSPAPATDVHPLLAARWSPRAFDSAAELTVEQEFRLLEAARWAPSASNSQPWRFLVARRGEASFDTLFASLAPGNKLWAGSAAALLLAAAQTMDAEGNQHPWAAYDLGQAIAHLSVQAEHEGLSVHQMGGFDRDAVSNTVDLPKGVEPFVLVALGVRAPATVLPEALAAREVGPRSRRPVNELLLDQGGHDVN